LKPQLSYGQHFGNLLNTAIDSRLNKNGMIYRSPLLRSIFGVAAVFLIPRGVVTRTAQIVGSFILVNGTITLLNRHNFEDRVKQTIYGSQPTVLPSVKH
jgi:hypothetical protein